MNSLAMFLGMSLSIGGVGGLLSGIFAHSLRRAIIWAIGFGVLEAVLLIVIASRFMPIGIMIAIFWGLVGWFAVGRFLEGRRSSKAARAGYRP